MQKPAAEEEKKLICYELVLQTEEGKKHAVVLDQDGAMRLAIDLIYLVGCRLYEKEKEQQTLTPVMCHPNKRVRAEKKEEEEKNVS
jgi:hypothetical protein